MEQQREEIWNRYPELITDKCKCHIQHLQASHNEENPLCQDCCSSLQTVGSYLPSMRHIIKQSIESWEGLADCGQ